MRFRLPAKTGSQEHGIRKMEASFSCPHFSEIGLRRILRTVSTTALPIASVLLMAGRIAVQAELSIFPVITQPQRVFAGDARHIEVVLRNPGSEPVKADLRVRIYQTATEMLVYPTNLLAELSALAGNATLGVFDPNDELKPILRTLAIAFQDLVQDGTEKFHGTLAVFGPFASPDQTRAGLGRDIRALAKRGVAVVWLQPPLVTHAPLKPSFYTVRDRVGTVVVGQGDLVSNLKDRPEAQLNLLRLAETALHPTALDLPDAETQTEREP